MNTYHLTCPHNCYDTCGMLATVEEGILKQVDGDPKHPHTAGRLCAKGYAYVDRVYAPDRLRHPMLQSPRGSGRWQRLSWEEALERIAGELIRIHRQYQSLLPVCLYRGSGNIGALHGAPGAMLRGTGPYTEAVNVLCWAAGNDATQLDFGEMRTSDPRQMQAARTILLWGVNPAWTAPHQMNLIMAARDGGARVVVIDPVCTATASRADQHLALRPGTDGALALGMARAILEAGLADEAFLGQHALGWPQFRAYLEREITVEWAAAETGLAPGLIRETALAYATGGPATIWIGYGMQRHRGAGQAVRAIDALAAAAGQIGKPGAGVQYGHLQTMVFDGHLRSFDRYPARPNRQIDMGSISRTLPALTDPPVELLWITQANPLTQEPETRQFRQMLQALRMVVVVDQFLTETAAAADIVLPATTFPEQWDLVSGYWHHFVSISEQAIAPRFEAQSDLSIAWMLSRTLNRLSPNFCAFPSEGSEREWVEHAWLSADPRRFGSATFTHLLKGLVPADLPAVAWSDFDFATPSGRIELLSERAAARGLPALPVYQPPAAAPAAYPFRLLTPHTCESLHSQFHGPDWGLRACPHPVVEMHPEPAGRLGIGEGSLVRLSNPHGELELPVHLTTNVPETVLLAYEACFPGLAYNVNALTSAAPLADGYAGVAYADCFVAVAPAERRGQR